MIMNVMGIMELFPFTLLLPSSVANQVKKSFKVSSDSALSNILGASFSGRLWTCGQRGADVTVGQSMPNRHFTTDFNQKKFISTQLYMESNRKKGLKPMRVVAL